MEADLLNRMKELISERIGVAVRGQDDPLLQKIVAERVRALHLSGAEQYCELLSSAADIRREREALAIPLTTAETYFFRDSGQHLLLKDRLLPELLERRELQRALRIWSAGCSSGEEAYSLAILLDELMPEQSQWDILIVGTDINRHAIEKARRGVYTEWSFRGMSDDRRQRYFRHHKDGWVLDDSIRARVRFQLHDLVADTFPDHAAGLHEMDLILCRNTFIYMTPRAISRIADKLADTLADGGILVTGHGELYAHHLGKLRARVFPESIVYQKAAAPFVLPVAEQVTPAPPPVPARPAVSSPRQPRVSAVAPAPEAAKPVSEGGEKKQTPSELQQAWRYANQGRRELAEHLCRKMTSKNPLDAEPYYLLALLAQDQGNFAAATDLLRKVIYLAPSFVAAYLDLGDLYAREGDAARAARMRSTARDLLQAMPGNELVKLYGASTVDEVLQYVERVLK